MFWHQLPSFSYPLVCAMPINFFHFMHHVHTSFIILTLLYTFTIRHTMTKIVCIRLVFLLCFCCLFSLPPLPLCKQISLLTSTSYILPFRLLCMFVFLIVAIICISTELCSISCTIDGIHCQVLVLFYVTWHLFHYFLCYLWIITFSTDLIFIYSSSYSCYSRFYIEINCANCNHVRSTSIHRSFSYRQYDNWPVWYLSQYRYIQ